MDPDETQDSPTQLGDDSPELGTANSPGADPSTEAEPATEGEILNANALLAQHEAVELSGQSGLLEAVRGNIALTHVDNITWSAVADYAVSAVDYYATKPMQEAGIKAKPDDKQLTLRLAIVGSEGDLIKAKVLLELFLLEMRERGVSSVDG